MSTSTWLYVVLTLFAAVVFSYILGLTPTGVSKTGAHADGENSKQQQPQAPTQDVAGDDSDVEVDKRLPPLANQCLCCSKDAEDLGKPMLRCSQCKNAFYCNATCQKQEWARHKFNCSLLPPEGLKPARIPITRELVDEVEHVDLILKAWLTRVEELTNGLKDNLKKVNAADLPEALPILQLKMSPAFDYKNLPKQQLERHPFRNPIIQIARLYLIALVATHSNPKHLNKFADRLTKIQEKIPTHLAPLYGPKIVSRPAYLSPGEYDTFAEIAPMVITSNLEEIGMDKNEMGRWVALSFAMMKLWNAGLVPRSPQPAAETETVN